MSFQSVDVDSCLLPAESLQSCLTLCNPIDYSPPGSFVHGILQQEYRNGLPCPLPGDLPDPGIEPLSPMSPALAGGFFTTKAHLGSPIAVYRTHCMPTILLGAKREGISTVTKFVVFWRRDEESKYYNVDWLWDKNIKVFWQQGGSDNSKWTEGGLKKYC